jgi:hypothetical protein
MGVGARDELDLDILWLKDESLEDSANLPPPDVIAAEIDSPISHRLTIRASPLCRPSHDLHCRRPPSRPRPVRRNRFGSEAVKICATKDTPSLAERRRIIY